MKGDIIQAISKEIREFIENNFPDYDFISMSGEVALAKNKIDFSWAVIDLREVEPKCYIRERNDAYLAYDNYLKQLVYSDNAVLNMELEG